MKYAILDIETTGLSPAREKITEIAIFLHDGTKITEMTLTTMPVTGPQVMRWPR